MFVFSYVRVCLIGRGANWTFKTELQSVFLVSRCFQQYKYVRLCELTWTFDLKEKKSRYCHHSGVVVVGVVVVVVVVVTNVNLGYTVKSTCNDNQGTLKIVSLL